MKQLKYISILVILTFSTTASSQTFEEFKKQYQSELQGFKAERDQKILEMQNEFNEYVKERDKEFADFLKNRWEEIQVMKGKLPPERPKPVETPVYEPEPEEREENIIEKLPIISTEKIVKEETLILPLIQNTAPTDFGYLSSAVNYYGNEVELEYDPEILKCTIYSIDNNSISDWFTKASLTNYNHLVNQLLTVKDRHALNDWAYYLLIKKVSHDIFSNDDNQANILHWFLMIRSGYNVKLGYLNNKTTLLIPSHQNLYHTNYLTIDNNDYYVMQYLGEILINTYTMDYPGSDKIIDFNIYFPINLSSNEDYKTISISYSGETYSFELSYNPDLIELFKDYPVTSMNVYFDAALSAQAKEALFDNLLPVLENMSQEEAANFLLYFTQNAFEYQTDPEQFGKEKFLFPEETLYYPYSDCEDRSAFYTYLIKEFLKLDIVGLEYPLHIATAVNFSNDVDGDYIIFNGKKYIIADPTYINAPVGRAMPRYKKTEAKVIELNNFRHVIFLADKNWSVANQAGAYRGGIRQDHAFDNEGNCYLTGYFVNLASFDIIELNTGSEDRHGFVAKFDPRGNLLWARNLDGSGVSAGISIDTDPYGEAVIMGSYSGSISIDDLGLVKNRGQDIFLLKLDGDGNAVWLSNADLDEDETRLMLKYAITFNNEGEHIHTDLYAENPGYSSEGIFLKNDGNIILSGSFNNTTGLGMRKISFARMGELDYVEMLKSINDELLQQDVDKSIAGVFAALQIIKDSGTVIPGSAAQEALDKYNPSFKKECDDIYESLGEITFIKNEHGVINILTEDGDPVLIDRLKVHNNAQIKISSLGNGREQLNILSGIQVGKFFVWFSLNYVIMYPQEGNMLFDYDSDHTQKLLNFKKDML